MKIINCLKILKKFKKYFQAICFQFYHLFPCSKTTSVFQISMISHHCPFYVNVTLLSFEIQSKRKVVSIPNIVFKDKKCYDKMNIACNDV